MRDESKCLVRRLTAAAWVPALLWLVILLGVLPSLLPLPEFQSTALAGTRLDAATAKTVFALNLLLLSANALALTWLITLRAFARLHPQAGGSWTPRRAVGAIVSPPGKSQPTEVGCHQLTNALTIAGVVTVGVGSLATVFLATLVGGEQPLAMALFIYAPTLAVAYGLFGLAAARMTTWWKVALAGAALWATMLATQLLYLEPDGELPSEMMFALSSLPLAVALAIWLVTWSVVAREVPAAVTR